MLKNIKILLFTLMIVASIFPVLVSADEIPSLIKQTKCTCTGSTAPTADSATTECQAYCGQYQLNDFVALMIIIANIILLFSGSLSLIAFIIGGFMFLISGGNKERIERGKSAIIGSVIGLVIVFASYLIIDTIMTNLNITKWNDVSQMVKTLE